MTPAQEQAEKELAIVRQWEFQANTNQESQETLDMIKVMKRDAMRNKLNADAASPERQKLLYGVVRARQMRYGGQMDDTLIKQPICPWCEGEFLPQDTIISLNGKEYHDICARAAKRRYELKGVYD